MLFRSLLSFKIVEVEGFAQDEGTVEEQASGSPSAPPAQSTVVSESSTRSFTESLKK